LRELVIRRDTLTLLGCDKAKCRKTCERGGRREASPKRGDEREKQRMVPKLLVKRNRMRELREITGKL